MRIIAQNLSYVYSEKSKSLAVKALNNIALTIEEGEFFGIIGKTGSGKSTFIQHLNGLIPVQKDRGSLIVGEYNLTDKKPNFKGLRANVGMVFQYPEHQLFAETVFEDVAFGIKNFMPQTSPEQTAQMVESAIAAVGLNYNEIKDKSPFELSGGQKRRVAIAGVIVTRPQVLVLDEPAAGLDPQGKREFLYLLKRLHKDFVKTVILVSHDMNLVAEYCTSVAVFNDGNLVKSGTPKEVFNDEEMLNNAGLELPTTEKLTLALKKKGIELNNDLTVDSFINAIVEKFGNKGGASLWKN